MEREMAKKKYVKCPAALRARGAFSRMEVDEIGWEG
jgi:hypothetical protein